MCVRQLHQNHLDKQLKKGEFSNSWKRNLTVTSIPYLQFYLIHASIKVKGGGANPWYFHLSYKVKKSASCQKSGEGEAAPLTPTPDDTCLWCKHIVCSGVFAWSQRTRQLIGAQNYEWTLWREILLLPFTQRMNSSIGRRSMGRGSDEFFDICFVTAKYMYIILWIGCFVTDLTN